MDIRKIILAIFETSLVCYVMKLFLVRKRFKILKRINAIASRNFEVV